MRRTQAYGYTEEDVDFVYPTPNDLLQMQKNIATRIKDLKFKICSNDNRFFGAFQVVLSNGVCSPVFTGKGENDQNMQSVNIQDYAIVKRVNGSKGDSCIHKLSFKKKDGTEITKVETGWNRDPYGEDSVIADDEEIIGVFGTKD
jgi:hypothetical protein